MTSFRFKQTIFSNLGLSLILISLFLLVGCSFEASIQSLSESSSLSQATGTEVVSGSNQNNLTSRGYKAQVSVSYQDAKSVGVTTRGNKVFTNVQGTIFKE